MDNKTSIIAIFNLVYGLISIWWLTERALIHHHHLMNMI